jgi:hypothetical protein
MRVPRAAALAAALLLTGVLAGCSGSEKVTSYQGYDGTAIVSADGRTVTVGRFGHPCLGTATVFAVQKELLVALWIRDVAPASAQAGSCQANAVQDIRLRAPLGRRKLVNGADLKALRWLDGRLVLHPRMLPAGYALTQVLPGVRTAGPARYGPGCEQVYASEAGTLSITQSAGSLLVPAPGPPGWQPVHIRGVIGVATRNVITWQERGLTDVISAGNPADPQVLSTAELVAIADSAP